jgi:hypothetical protein
LDWTARHFFLRPAPGLTALGMSALGQKRTIFTAPFYDCFAPESGHLSAWGGRKDL